MSKHIFTLFRSDLYLMLSTRSLITRHWCLCHVCVVVPQHVATNLLFWKSKWPAASWIEDVNILSTCCSHSFKQKLPEKEGHVSSRMCTFQIKERSTFTMPFYKKDIPICFWFRFKFWFCFNFLIKFDSGFHSHLNSTYDSDSFFYNSNSGLDCF